MIEALKILFPKRCVLCTGDISQDMLCISCESLCHPFLGTTADPSALFYYEHAIRDLIIKAKYGRSIVHAMALNSLIDKSLNDKLKTIEAFAPEAIVSVPTHWIKKSWRGLDLPAMFASKLASRLGIKSLGLLERKRLGRAQSGIKNRLERLGRMRGLFLLKKNTPKIKRLLLVDDITTSGATFDELKRILQSSSREIRCLAIAKTP